MSHQSYREESRKNWGTDSINGNLSLDQIKAGAILRIADAAEKMAQNHAELIRQRDYFEREAKMLRSSRDYLKRSNAALRGHITRMKRMAVKP